MMNTGPVKCNFCEKEFNQMSYCKRHMKRIHKLTADGKPITEPGKVKEECIFCNKLFTQRGSLQRHINSVHMVIDGQDTYECNLCDFKTSRKFSIGRHISAVHENAEQNFKQVKKLFQCSQCSASFNNKVVLRRHEMKIHHFVRSRVIARKCPICPFISNALNKQEMLTHFKEKHSILIDWEQKTFDSVIDFHQWKVDIENKTKSSFIRTTQCDLKQSWTYYCHRSGLYKKNNLLRRTKRTGSCKINGFCPASISVKIVEGNKLNVMFQPTHVGHRNQLKHIRLTTDERKMIADKLSCNKTPNQILADIRESRIKDDCLKRIHITNKRDIYNIAKSDVARSLLKSNKQIKELELENVITEDNACNKIPDQIMTDIRESSIKDDCLKRIHITNKRDIYNIAKSNVARSLLKSNKQMKELELENVITEYDACNKTPDQIMNDVRESRIKDDCLKRIHITNKRDIYNIAKCNVARSLLKSSKQIKELELENVITKDNACNKTPDQLMTVTRESSIKDDCQLEFENVITEDGEMSRDGYGLEIVNIETVEIENEETIPIIVEITNLQSKKQKILERLTGFLDKIDSLEELEYVEQHINALEPNLNAVNLLVNMSNLTPDTVNKSTTM